MENCAFGALAAALLLCCVQAAPAASEPLRVLYAESFQPQTTNTPGAQKAGAATTRVQAFGRTFELQLEDNSRLLRAASGQTRERLGAMQVLKGSISNAPGSWVRLTLNGGRYSGAFWDGAELYAIAPRETLEGALLTPMPSAASAIYRLSDTQGGLFSGTCALDSRAGAARTPTQKFRALIQELQSTVAPTAAREIEISMIGDFEFTSRYGNNSLAKMVANVNVVDGIFSSQVGVATIPTDFITFPGNTDPFSAADPSTLLNELATYRENTAQVRSRGLAHLLTGRELTGTTVGIAFRGTLCEPRQGVSLSESSATIDSPLVMAHELGHNFGAPHDGAFGSECQGVPTSFLMGPNFNGSSTFSSCSLGTMQPHVDAAACVVPARDRDVAVTAPPSKIFAHINEAFDVPFEVSALGAAAATNVRVNVPVNTQSFISATMPGATCSVESNIVGCRLPPLAPGTSATLTLRMSVQTPTLLNLTATVFSAGDTNASNNSATARVRVAEARDFDVTPLPATQTVPRNAPFEVTLEVAAIGTETINDMQLEFSLPPATLQSFTTDSGSCIQQDLLLCQLGTMAAGERRRVRARMVLDRVGSHTGNVTVFETANPAFRRSESLRVDIQPLRDISVSAMPPTKIVAIGSDATWPVEVRSNGVQAVNDVHVQLSAPSVALSVDSPIGAGCTPIMGGLDCALGTLAAGTVTPLTLRARASAPVVADINVHARVLPADEVTANDFAQVRLDARVGSEVSLGGLTGTISDVEGRAEALSFQVAAAGANAARDVRLSISLPQGFEIASAQLFSGQCAVRSDARNLADCTAASLAPNLFATATVNYTPPQPGSFDGSIAVTASEDADPSNNTLPLHFVVVPNIDARIVAPAQPRIAAGIGADFVFTLSTNQNALPSASVQFLVSPGLDEFSVSAPGATCTFPLPHVSVCTFTSIAANSNIPVTVRVRGSARPSLSIAAELMSPQDMNAQNNQAALSFPILPPADVSISVVNPAPSVRVGEEWHLLLDLGVTGGEVAQSFFELHFDSAQTTLSKTMAPTACQGTPSPVRCTLVISSVLAPGTYRADVVFVPRTAGTASITVRSGAVNDLNPSNDNGVVNVTAVNAAPPPVPPAPPPPPPSRSGGGGGGSMSWLLAALLLAMRHLRRIALEPALP